MQTNDKTMKILKFSSSTCSPCKNLSKTLSEMQAPFPVEEVDVDSDRELALMYKIRSIPTLLLVDQEGAVVSAKTGAASKANLERWFESFLLKSNTKQLDT